MARTKRSALMDSRNKRMALAPGKRHMECLQTGAYLLYHRPRNGASGNWLARWVVPETRKQVQKRLGAADDLLEANGITTLSYAQAKAGAQAWFAACAQGAATGSAGGGHSQEALTVTAALRGYLLDKKRDGMKGHKITEQTVNAHIIPTLGELLVVKLTASKLRDWHQTLAETPRRKTGRVREVVEYLEGPTSEEAMRSRKNTANRILAVLKAGLNWALRDVGEGLPRPWRLVSPFKGVDASRVRFLNASEQLRLLAGCEGDFRQLVQAALFTGARYGELTRLRVEDFNASTGQVFIQFSKSGRSRHIKLTSGAVAWFSSVTNGRPGQELLLRRCGVHRTTRKDKVSADAWATYVNRQNY